MCKPAVILQNGGCRFRASSSSFDFYIQPFRAEDGSIKCNRAPEIECGVYANGFWFGCNNYYCCFEESGVASPQNDPDTMHPREEAHWTKVPGQCSKQCGGGTRSLSWECRIMPEGEQDVEIPRWCPLPGGGDVSRDSGNKCGYPQDDSGGDRNWCEINDGYFDGDTFHLKKFSELPTEEECNLQPCEQVTHELEVQAWSPCDAPCGGGQQFAVPVCVSSEQRAVDLSLCAGALADAGLEPGSDGRVYRACNTDACVVPDLVVTAPEGGEEALVGSTQTVSWAGGDDTLASTVELVLDERVVQTLAVGAGQSSVVLQVPAVVPVFGYAVRVCKAASEPTCASSQEFGIARQENTIF